MWCPGNEIAQTITGFEIGKKYSVSWATAGRPGNADGNLWVLIDAVTIADYIVDNTDGFIHTNVEFIATATSHRLRFFHNNPWARSIFIDDVNIVDPLETFPEFTVPGFENEMENLQEMFFMHYSENRDMTPTYNSGWLPMYSWVGIEPLAGNYKRNFYNSLLSSRNISTNGYVSCEQHYGLAHAEGWPFPLWNQNSGWGRHYKISDHLISIWGVSRSTSATDWTRTGASTISVTQTEGWKLNLTSAAASIQTPTFYVRNMVVPFFRLEWSTSGLGAGA